MPLLQLLKSICQSDMGPVSLSSLIVFPIIFTSAVSKLSVSALRKKNTVLQAFHAGQSLNA